MTIYVPLDIETTGLDPEEDYLLEIAWAILDEKFEPLTPTRYYLFDHSQGEWQDVWAQIQSNEAVRNMHEQSGLYADLKTKTAWASSSIALMLRDDIARYTKSENEAAHLMGFNIGFDRSFLQKDSDIGLLFDTDVLGVRFHHRLLDLSSVKLLWQSAGVAIPEIENLRKHRAKDDVNEVIEFAQAIRNEVVTAFDEVSV